MGIKIEIYYEIPIHLYCLTVIQIEKYIERYEFLKSIRFENKQVNIQQTFYGIMLLIL